MTMGSRAAAILASILASAAALAAGSDKAASAEPEPGYDPATVIDVMATVMEVREVPPGSPLSGVHLLVRTQTETLDVYLAPAEFLKEFEISFAKGDRLQIAGSKVKLGETHVVLLREVRKRETTLYFRDRKGTPNWKGAGKSTT
jgi:hypothetical protein